MDGVVVDFELTAGPGDDDVGTAGHTPEAPDMSCTTAGGSHNRAATCTVEYTEQDNEGGSDAVLAWIDADGLDATVEADLAEGENQHAPGTGGCDVDSKGPGLGAEPDQTDCVEKRWMARVPAAVDLEAETDSAPVGSSASIEASVFDQFGDLFAGAGRSTTVSLELLAGSVHDPGDGSDFGSPDLGSCDTGTSGRCSLALGSSVRASTGCAATSPAGRRRARRHSGHRSAPTARTSCNAHGWPPPRRRRHLTRRRLAGAPAAAGPPPSPDPSPPAIEDPAAVVPRPSRRGPRRRARRRAATA